MSEMLGSLFRIKLPSFCGHSFCKKYMFELQQQAIQAYNDDMLIPCALCPVMTRLETNQVRERPINRIMRQGI
uniref:Zf-C3HC4 domain-containing protein n=2 Tax=Caenorhabditis tropicalis TaxID=1561998 RepID=A0A1I7TY23_9PELO